MNNIEIQDIVELEDNDADVPFPKQFSSEENSDYLFKN
jgi:hypothetical protein